MSLVESLQDILAKKKIEAPDEIGAIKDYVKRKYQSACSVKLQRGALIVSVPGSALAATLQLERPSIIKACGVKTKLVIRGGR